ncbi:MAG: hypothetical protein FJW66_08735, partial [Actinobacteria bacterium]|nr:hypothetical protein [Actinomycetota bacterium]
MIKQVVFFGPFIGELGWELLFWHGWVRKVCKTDFKECHKIAASVPGRQAFYPYVDEFWGLPDWFLNLKTSAHGYCTDGWRNGYPGKAYEVEQYRSLTTTLKIILRGLYRRRIRSSLRQVFTQEINWIEEPLNIRDISQHAEELLNEFKNKLPGDAIVFVPWKKNFYEKDELEFGVDISDGEVLKSWSEKVKPITFKYQLFEYLLPTGNGEKAFNKIFNGKNLISVFPRYRQIRRPDKNWPKEKYVDLIRKLQDKFSGYQIAILGEPGGVHFMDGIPEGCLDLINIPSGKRFDIHLAALRKSYFAVGSL